VLGLVVAAKRERDLQRPNDQSHDREKDEASRWFSKQRQLPAVEEIFDEGPFLEEPFHERLPQELARRTPVEAAIPERGRTAKNGHQTPSEYEAVAHPTRAGKESADGSESERPRAPGTERAGAHSAACPAIRAGFAPQRPERRDSAAGRR
jgi:hypothetical protein